MKQHETRDTKEPNMGTPSPPPIPAPSTCCAGNGCVNCNDSGLLIDQPVAVVERWGSEAHDGAGWYYYDEEYQDEGSVGAFVTEGEAVAHAQAAGYRFEEESGCPACSPGPCVPSAHGMGPDWT